MAYTALARRWRPRNFAEMTGQEHVLRALGNALASGRVHHAFLFTGTRGVGKTTVARILAKCLNCDKGMVAEPCGECASCREIDAGRSVDLIEVDAASRTKVDDTRELLDNVQYAPTRSRYKVYLIDEVHMLSSHSFNALLKTLEEPPPHVKFLLATTDPQKLPVTVLSRCLQFNLKRLSLGLIIARLAHILAAEGIEAEPAALALLAQAADGSLRDALSLLDQLLAFGNGAVREAETREMLGTVARDHVERITRLLVAGEPVALFACEQELESFGPDYGDLLDQLAGLLERVALTQVVPGYEGDELYARELLAELAAACSPEDLQLYYQAAILGRRDLALAPEPRTGFRMTLIRMLAFRVAGPAGDAPAGPVAVGGGTARTRSALAGGTPAIARAGGAAAGEAVAAPLPPTAPPAAGAAGGGAFDPAGWPALVGQLDIDPPTRMLALHCALLGREGALLRLALDPKQASARTKAREEKLAQALSRQLREPVRVEIEVRAAEIETPAQAADRATQESIAAAHEQLVADPVVQSIQQRFGATIHPDSVRPL
jgi:DNA polymerase III subunit gamma/tau